MYYIKLNRLFFARFIMLNTPDPHAKQELKNKMDSVSEQIDTSKNDFMSAASNVKDTVNSESERFQEDLKDMKHKVIDLSGKGMTVAKQTISSNLEAAKDKANRAAHCAMSHAEKSLQSTGNYVRRKPCQSLAIALGVGFMLGKLMSRK